MKSLFIAVNFVLLTFVGAVVCPGARPADDHAARLATLEAEHLASETQPWRRTADGWELSTYWTTHVPSSEASPIWEAWGSIHPALVALFILLLSLLALQLQDLGQATETNLHLPTQRIPTRSRRELVGR